MTPLQRLGQCFMLGVRGEALLDEERDTIRRLVPGGFILFRENLATREQVRALAGELWALGREASGVPPLIAIDEEGGFLCHTSRFAARFPAAAALAAAGDPDLPRAVAECVGHRLRHLGIALDLAPVLDVNDCRDNPVIGVRSYGAQAPAVARYGRGVIEGLASAGVLSAGKHFPGHGSTSLDSHRDLPVLRHDRARLDAVELAPYREAISAGLPVVLTAHVAYPAAADCGDLPATLCPSLLRGTLREQLGFEHGVLMSDDLGMGAIRDHFAPAEIAVRGRSAGLDVFLFARDPAPADATWHALREALDRGRVDPADFERSVARVLLLKERWLGNCASGGGGDPHAWRDGARDWDENEERLARISARVAGDAVGLAAGALDPGGFLRGRGEPWGVVAIEATAGGDRFEARSVEEVARNLPGFGGCIALDAVPAPSAARAALERSVRWASVVVLEAHRSEPSRELLELARALEEGGRRVAWVSLLRPVPLPSAMAPVVHLRSWGFDVDSLRAVFACLAGMRPPSGADPFALRGP